MKFCQCLDWYGLVWFGQISEAACWFREVICGFREVIFELREIIFGFWEVIWVDGFKIRCVGRTGQVGGYVRWLGSSGGSRKWVGQVVGMVWCGLVKTQKLNSRP